MVGTLAAGTRLGPYEIEGLIGAGGMGQVYRAKDPRLGRSVAVKIVAAAAPDADAVRRFETEARAAGTLDHPNLLVVYDVGREGTISYIVSELLEGQTLRDRLHDGAMPERVAIAYATQIAQGLAAAHERGIVHRDLKPDNLFLTRDRRLKILDFGVAKLVRAHGDDHATVAADTLTDPGVTVGTVGYMAPEQIRGDAIDHRVDIFALGVVLHEMLSGVRPFKRDTTADTMTAILRDDPPDLPSTVSVALDRVVRRCLEKRRDDRFHSTHDLAIALDLLATPATSTAVAVASERPAISRRRVLGYGVSSLALLGAGAAAGMLLDRQALPAAPPTFRRITFRRGVIRSARMAPDGQTILYGAVWEGGRCRVHSVRVDGPESRALDLPDANLLAISRSGELAIALGPHDQGVITYGTLARVPMAGGAPRQLLEDVKFADWSPDGKDLAIVRRVNETDRLEFPIGKVLVEFKAGDAATALGFPRISPDGRRVAFVQYRNSALLTGKVSIVDQTGTVTALTGEFGNIHGLVWRGDEIWFTATEDLPLIRSMKVIAPGKAPRTVHRVPGNLTIWDTGSDGRLVIAHTDDHSIAIVRGPEENAEHDLSWLDMSWVEDLSIDGRLMIFNESGLGGGPSRLTYIRGTDGSPAVRLGTGRGVALSPDARWAVCLDGALLSAYLELVPIGPGEARRLPENGLRYINAHFLPDGERLIVRAVESGHAAKLYVMDLQGGRPTPLTPEGIFWWTVSPDGSTIAARAATTPIRLYPVDGSASRDISGFSALEVPIGWIRDGLLVTRPDDPRSPFGEVYRVDVTTGRTEPWKNILPRDRSGIMGLGMFRATPDGRTQVHTWFKALSNLYVAEGLA